MLSNDFLYFSYVIARGTVGINHNLEFSNFSFDVIEYLNSLNLEKSGFDLNDCFIYNNYSPNKGCKRMYFQNENAIKIDIIRLQIEKWKKEGKLSDDEYFYLLACYDYPVIKGITGMREYDKQKSVFCKKKNSS